MKKKMNAPKEVAKRVKEVQAKTKMKEAPKSPTMGKGKRNVKVTNSMSDY